MKSIRPIEKWLRTPEKLKRAENVKLIVIDGETFEKKDLHYKAKQAARDLLRNNRHVFSQYSIETLNAIINDLL